MLALVIEVRDHPSTATAVVRYQGAPVGEGNYALEYRTTAPNGVECGPVCRYAAPVQLTLQL